MINKNAVFKKYMKKCIALAKKSYGKVSPNPFVGAVILDKDGNIAGFGRHEKYGEAHAEVNAFKMAGDKAKGGTIIVNLEPCSHYGKTPPCADLIIEKGIKKLVVGIVDPFEKVAGKGIKKCKDAGIEVITGILEKECRQLNEIFLKNVNKKSPFIAIKTATTADGKIATRTGESKWITAQKARNHVQKLRNKYDAILTGSNTVNVDNPSMTCRIKNGRNPVRVVVDSKLSTDPGSKIFNNDGCRVYIACAENIKDRELEKYPQSVSFIKCPLKGTKVDLAFLTKKLFELGISSILIEAGGDLNGAFLKENLVDKIYHFIAPKIIGDKNAKNWVEGIDLGKLENALKLDFKTVKNFGPDILIQSYVELLGGMA